MSNLPDKEKEKTGDLLSSSQDFLPLDFADKQASHSQKKPVPLSGLMKKAASPADNASSPEKKPIPLAAMKKKSPEPETTAIPIQVSAPEEPPEARPAPSIASKEETIVVKPPLAVPSETAAAPTNPVQEKKAIKLKSSATSPSGADPEDFDAKMKRIFDDELQQKKNAELAAAKAREEAAANSEAKKEESRAKTSVPLSSREKASPAVLTETKNPPEEEEKQPHPLISGRNPVKRKVLRNISSIGSGNASVGQILQESRISAGLSIAQVEQLTKIKVQYLEAIERDDHKRLPPMVYVNAYIKTLCYFYSIDEAETQALLSNLKEETDKHTVSGEIIAKLEEEKHVNYEEELKVKRILIYSSLALGTILLTIATIAVAFFASSNGKKAEPPGATPAILSSVSKVTPFSGAELEKFVPPTQQTMSELFSSKK